MSVEVRDNPDAARYEIREDGQLVGSLRYRLKSDRITLIHTEIDDGYSGRGLATELVRGALEDARTRRLTVVPRCSFVASFIRRSPDDYLPLVAPALQEQLMHGERHE